MKRPLLNDRAMSLLRDGLDGGGGHRPTDLDDLLCETCAEAHRLEAEHSRVERRITELAEAADQQAAATELRMLWLRLRSTSTQLAETRELLAGLKELANATAVPQRNGHEDRTGA